MYVEVQIDLYDIDDDDLIQELRCRGYIVLEEQKEKIEPITYFGYEFLSSEDPMQYSIFN